MKSTRDKIIQTLLHRPNSSINELAEAVGINAISVRHHLTNLQADGQVMAEEERHGVGRPRLVYFLTEKGLEKFPTRYLRLTNRLLDQLKDIVPQETIEKIFQQMASDLASKHAARAEFMSMEQKLNLLKEVLIQEGFTVEWEKQGEDYLVHEITCPYIHIGRNHPEVCVVDQEMISTILSVPAEKMKCVLHGDKHCTYIIAHADTKETNE